MANQAIVEWLRRYLQAGYDLGTLKTTLLSHGYNEAQIDEAVRVLYGQPEIRHVIHLSKTTIALVVAVIFTILITMGGIFYFSSMPKAPEQLMDVRTELFSSSVKPGDRLTFNVELTSLGAAKRYDITVRYEVERNGDIITFKEDEVGLETSRSYRTFVSIPNTAEQGDYLLRTTALYDGKTAKSTSIFKVVEMTAATCSDGIQNQGEINVDCGGPCAACESCYDGIQNQGESGVDCGGPCKACSTSDTTCDDGNICTEVKLVDGVCSFVPLNPCCGDGNCEVGENCPVDCNPDDPFASMNIWEKFDAIKEMAKTDDASAAGYCTSFDNNLHMDRCYDNVAQGSAKVEYCDNIQDERTKEECYVEVAEEASNHEICEKIVTETRRDRCYMHFAKTGIDYSICEKVSDYYLKQLCNSMKSLQENSPPQG